jgi:hypothetical protein
MSNIYNNISQTLRPIAQTCGWNPQTGFSRNAQRAMYITASAATVVIAGIVAIKLHQTGALHAGANRLSSLASTIGQKYSTFSFTKTAPSVVANASIASLTTTAFPESPSASLASSARESVQSALSEAPAIAATVTAPQDLPTPATEALVVSSNQTHEFTSYDANDPDFMPLSHSRRDVADAFSEGTAKVKALIEKWNARLATK